MFRVVVEEFNDGRKIIDYYSDRNFIDYGKEPKYRSSMPETTSQSQHIASNEIVSQTNKLNKDKWNNQRLIALFESHDGSTRNHS